MSHIWIVPTLRRSVLLPSLGWEPNSITLKMEAVRASETSGQTKAPHGMKSWKTSVSWTSHRTWKLTTMVLLPTRFHWKCKVRIQILGNIYCIMPLMERITMLCSWLRCQQKAYNHRLCYLWSSAVTNKLLNSDTWIPWTIICICDNRLAREVCDGNTTEGFVLLSKPLFSSTMQSNVLLLSMLPVVTFAVDLDGSRIWGLYPAT